MKERPILFSAPMVRAILAGIKTQTRRVVKEPQWATPNTLHLFNDAPWAIDPYRGDRDVPCPYGQPGDMLWVRESLRFVRVGENYHEHAVYAADGVRVPRCPDLLPQFCDGMAFGLARSVPSIHMPRWASRITLEITGVRVERLQDISEHDALQEGMSGWAKDERCETARDGYRVLWEQINGPGSWSANPWVWVVEFRRTA